MNFNQNLLCKFSTLEKLIRSTYVNSDDNDDVSCEELAAEAVASSISRVIDDCNSRIFILTEEDSLREFKRLAESIHKMSIIEEDTDINTEYQFFNEEKLAISRMYALLSSSITKIVDEYTNTEKYS